MTTSSNKKEDLSQNIKKEFYSKRNWELAKKSEKRWKSEKELYNLKVRWMILAAFSMPIFWNSNKKRKKNKQILNINSYQNLKVNLFFSLITSKIGQRHVDLVWRLKNLRESAFQKECQRETIKVFQILNSFGWKEGIVLQTEN